MFGKGGTKEGEFLTPRGITIDHQQRVYVVDSDNNRIQVFDPEGRFLHSFSGPKILGGKLNGPYGITINKNGKIFIADNQNHRIMVFSMT